MFATRDDKSRFDRVSRYSFRYQAFGSLYRSGCRTLNVDTRGTRSMHSCKCRKKKLEVSRWGRLFGCARLRWSGLYNPTEIQTKSCSKATNPVNTRHQGSQRGQVGQRMFRDDRVVGCYGHGRYLKKGSPSLVASEAPCNRPIAMAGYPK